MNKFRAPKTPEKVRSFIELVNFCAAFIPNLATVSKPLRQLTRKNVTFRWGTEQENAFKLLKSKLGNAETLGISNVHAKTRVMRMQVQ